MGSDARHVHEAAQKELVKAFESLCGRHGRWEVWADWITMCACSISNAVDRAHREKREESYMTLCRKYTEADMQTMGKMLGMTVAALDENPDQDLLGEIFMALGLGNEHNGQFFTPYNVCQAMSSLTSGNIAEQAKAQGWISACDPACGAGALLVAFANECLRQKVNYQQSVLCVAQDIDFTVGLMCYIQLSLLGCAGYVVIGDTLAHPSTAYDRRGLIPRDMGNVWYTPMYFHTIWHWRRALAQVDMMFEPSQGPERQQAQPAPEQLPKKLCKGGKGKPRKNAGDAPEHRAQTPVLGVPVALIRGAGFVLRPWYEAGDVGEILYIDHDIDRVVASGQESEPNTERNHSGDDAVFVGAFVPATNPVKGLPDEALVMGTDTGSLYIAIKKDVIEIKGDIRHIGNTQQEGRTDATVDVTAAGVSLVNHLHTGNLGAPTSSPL